MVLPVWTAYIPTDAYDLYFILHSLLQGQGMYLLIIKIFTVSRITSSRMDKSERSSSKNEMRKINKENNDKTFVSIVYINLF
jgi:hypothetical protein